MNIIVKLRGMGFNMMKVRRKERKKMGKKEKKKIKGKGKRGRYRKL